MARTVTTPCRHVSGRDLFPARDYITGARFVVRACAGCGLVRTVPEPPEGTLDRYYPSGYYGGDARYRRALAAFLSFLHGRRAARVETMVGRPGRVLDVGCGQGGLLQAFRRRGWQAVGIERTNAAAAFARDRLGLEVHVGGWREAELAPASFDAIVMWHVLEHVSAPAELLCWAGSLLRHGGVLLVGVPDFGSLEARWARPGWFHLDVPRHLTHFTATTLQPLVRDAGLAVEATGGFAPEYDLFSFVQSALNRVGLTPNGLYNALRRPDARLLDADATLGWQILASAVLAVPLGVLGLAWTTAAGLLGCGATLTLYCRKPAAGEG